MMREKVWSESKSKFQKYRFHFSQLPEDILLLSKSGMLISDSDQSYNLSLQFCVCVTHGLVMEARGALDK